MSDEKYPGEPDDDEQLSIVDMVELGRDARRNDAKILKALKTLDCELRSHLRDAEVYYKKVDALMIERKIVLGIFIFALGGIGWILDRGTDYYCRLTGK